jgi:hypothetical protein
LVVLDIDLGADEKFVEKLPPTVTVYTGQGGHHFYYYTSTPVRNSAGTLGPHLDVRGEGGQVVAVGSIHPKTNNPYIWLHSPQERDVAPLPKWILERLERPERPGERIQPTQPIQPERVSKYCNAILQYELEKLNLATQGTRNTTLNAICSNIGKILHFGVFDITTIRARIKAVALRIGLDPDEVEATMDSGFGHGIKHPKNIKNAPRQLGDVTRPDVVRPITPVTRAGLRERMVDDPTVLWGLGDYPVVRASELFVLHGREGLGKSWLAMGLTNSLTNREVDKFLDIPVAGGSRPVLHVSAETISSVATGRFDKVCARPESENLWVLTTEDLDGFDLGDIKTVWGLIDCIKKNAIELMVLDPLADLWTGEEMNKDYVHLKAMIRLIMNETQTGIMLVCHEPKGSDKYEVSDENALRGGTALRATARSVVRLVKTLDPDIVEVKHSKSNVGRRHDPFCINIERPGQPEICEKPVSPKSAEAKNRRIETVKQYLQHIFPEKAAMQHVADMVEVDTKTLKRYVDGPLAHLVTISGHRPKYLRWMGNPVA